MLKIRLIGSYYEHDKLGIIRITGIKKDTVTFTNKIGHEFEENLKNNMIMPILLTAEWFEDFNFINDDWSVQDDTFSWGYKKDYDFKVSTNQSRDEFSMNQLCECSIRTVNQLQELYLGWSEELLEIEPKKH